MRGGNGWGGVNNTPNRMKRGRRRVGGEGKNPIRPHYRVKLQKTGVRRRVYSFGGSREGKKGNWVIEKGRECSDFFPSVTQGKRERGFVGGKKKGKGNKTKKNAKGDKRSGFLFNRDAQKKKDVGKPVGRKKNGDGIRECGRTREKEIP